jgi:hypothetical protein
VLRVLIDTNVLCADYYLRGTSARLLLDAGKRKYLQILVPVVVFRETVRRFRDETSGVVKELGRWRNKLSRVAPDLRFFENARSTLGAQANDYEANLRRVLQMSNASFLDFPEVSHDQILNRMLARKKPMKADGKGYQDTLIWETVLAQQPSDDSPIHFITNNWTDFAESAEVTALAAELVEDLEKLGSTAKAVRMYRRLGDFTDEHVKPKREILLSGATLSPGVEKSRVDLQAILGEALDGYASQLIGSSFDSYASDVNLEDVEIISAAFTGNSGVYEAFRISDEQIGARGEAVFPAELSASIWVEVPTFNEAGELEYIGDEYLRPISAQATIHITFEAIIDESQAKVVEFRPLASWAEDIDLGASSNADPNQGKLWK